MLIGEFPAWVIPLVGAISGIGSIIGCYFLSQLYGHEKPFPHTWISATADHYPEFILFRIGTISGAVFSLLTYFVNYFWILQLGTQNVFPVRRYQPQVSLVLGIMGSLALMGSTANLDTGRHKTSWHVACAVSFFLLSICSLVYNTFVSVMLQINGLRGISTLSTKLKTVLAVLTVLQLSLDLANRGPDSSDVLGNILEYSLAFSIIGFALITAWDVRAFRFVYGKYY